MHHNPSQSQSLKPRPAFRQSQWTGHLTFGHISLHRLVSSLPHHPTSFLVQIAPSSVKGGAAQPFAHFSILQAAARHPISLRLASLLRSTLSDRLPSRRLARACIASETIYSLVSPTFHFCLAILVSSAHTANKQVCDPCKTLHRLPLPPPSTAATFYCRFTFFPVANIRSNAIDSS